MRNAVNTMMVIIIIAAASIPIYKLHKYYSSTYQTYTIERTEYIPDTGGRARTTEGNILGMSDTIYMNIEEGDTICARTTEEHYLTVSTGQSSRVDIIHDMYKGECEQ